MNSDYLFDATTGSFPRKRQGSLARVQSRTETTEKRSTRNSGAFVSLPVAFAPGENCNCDTSAQFLGGSDEIIPVRPRAMPLAHAKLRDSYVLVCIRWRKYDRPSGMPLPAVPVTARIERGIRINSSWRSLGGTTY